MTVFSIQLFNFLLLLFLFYLLFMPALRGFFYSRRMRTRNYMADAALKLQRARERMARNRRLAESLEVDVEITRNDIESSGKRECDEIMINARSQREHIIAYIREQIASEERRAVKGVRRRLVDMGVEDARRKIGERITPETRELMINRALESMGRPSSAEAR